MNNIGRFFKETEGFDCIERKEGFASYKINPDKSCYIKHIYVIPGFRHQNIATHIANEIVELAKLHDCTVLLGSVAMGALDPTLSMMVLLKYGFKLSHIIHNTQGEELIVLKKEI